MLDDPVPPRVGEWDQKEVPRPPRLDYPRFHALNEPQDHQPLRLGLRCHHERTGDDGGVLEIEPQRGLHGPILLRHEGQRRQGLHLEPRTPPERQEAVGVGEDGGAIDSHYASLPRRSIQPRVLISRIVVPSDALRRLRTCAEVFVLIVTEVIAVTTPVIDCPTVVIASSSTARSLKCADGLTPPGDKETAHRAS